MHAAGSLSSRPGCMRKPSICLERPANGPLPQNPNPVVGKHRLAACYMILRERVSRREMTSTETDAWVWSSLVKKWDDAILGREKEKPQRSWCGNRRTLPWRTRSPANKGVKMLAEPNDADHFRDQHVWIKRILRGTKPHIDCWPQHDVVDVLASSKRVRAASASWPQPLLDILIFAWWTNGGIYSAKVTSQPHQLLRNVWKAVFWRWFSHEDVVAQRIEERRG